MSIAADSVAVWFEIPAADLGRAQKFYETLTGMPLKREKSPCGTLDMALFTRGGPEAAQGAVVKGEPFQPRDNGTMVYLNGGPDLAEPLSRVEAAGGTIVLPKTSIAPHGFIAVFLDTEGNRVGIHSCN